jgi:hypothetical protein
MVNSLTSIFSTGATSLVEAIGEALDKNSVSDEERLEQENEHTKAEQGYNAQLRELDIEDRKDVRDNQSRIQESEHAGWLSKNVHPILALITVVFTFGLYVFILYNAMGIGEVINQTAKEIILYILGGLTAMCTQIYSYFYGSSAKGHDAPSTKELAITHR